MQDQPKIPFGYKQVTGQLQKGDGIWNGTRFVKVKKTYPFAGYNNVVAIRKCEVVQPELPGIQPVFTPQDVVNLFAADAKRLCDQANTAMDEAHSKFIERMASSALVEEMEVE